MCDEVTYLGKLLLNYILHSSHSNEGNLQLMEHIFEVQHTELWQFEQQSCYSICTKNLFPRPKEPAHPVNFVFTVVICILIFSCSKFLYINIYLCKSIYNKNNEIN